MLPQGATIISIVQTRVSRVFLRCSSSEFLIGPLNSISSDTLQTISDKGEDRSTAMQIKHSAPTLVEREKDIRMQRM